MWSTSNSWNSSSRLRTCISLNTPRFKLNMPIYNFENCSETIATDNPISRMTNPIRFDMHHQLFESMRIVTAQNIWIRSSEKNMRKCNRRRYTRRAELGLSFSGQFLIFVGFSSCCKFQFSPLLRFFQWFWVLYTRSVFYVKRKF